VVIEKPMTLSKVDAEEVIHESLKVNKRVFCVMQNRYSPPSRWLKEVVESGVLGKVYMANINCFWNRDDEYYQGGAASYWKGKLAKDGGTLFTQFSHFLDTMYWLFGDITNIKASFYDFNHQHTTEFEDSGIVQFDFVKGGAGSLNYSTAVYGQNMESSLSIIGENGSVKVGGQYMNEIVYCHIKDYEQPVLEDTLPPNDYGKYKGSAANHQFVIQNVVDALKGNKTVTTNSLEGLKVVEIIENIYKLKR
jgi:predicted dehydrogenase